jgi:hypothetical protein
MRNGMRRFVMRAPIILLLCGVLYPGRAAAQPSVNFLIGGFLPLGDGDRSHDDVIQANREFLSFRVSDFNGVTVGGEFLAGLGDFFELGLGAGYYHQTVHSVYTDFVDDQGFEIQQEMRLRIAPFTATIRVLPFGRRAALRPYLGGGVGIFAWDYSESGDFIDGDFNVNYGRFNGSGAAVGPVVFGGLQIPIDKIAFGGEVRYQHATGELPRNEGFAGSEIDLSGWSWLATVNFRF